MGVNDYNALQADQTQIRALKFADEQPARGSTE
jgi:hypothetical protein